MIEALALPVFLLVVALILLLINTKIYSGYGKPVTFYGMFACLIASVVLGVTRLL